MLLSKEADVKWTANNKRYYESLGYSYTKQFDIVTVRVEDLPKGSHIIVGIQCDYCGREYQTEYRGYLGGRIIVPKDCCAKCQQQKTKECNLINFGVESKTQLPETREKMRKTLRENYGVDSPLQSKEIHNKAVESFIDRFGCDNPMRAQDVWEKANKTKMEKYGTKNMYNVPEFLQKCIDTNNERYGVDWQMQSDEVKSKSAQTLYVNGTSPSSRQQRHIHSLIGGELNYPVDRLALDIAFPDEKIYVEYDGNGHELGIRMGTFTNAEFKQRQDNRNTFLRYQGWKLIRIISPYDYLPSDEVMITIVRDAKVALKVKDEVVIDLGILRKHKYYGDLAKLPVEL